MERRSCLLAGMMVVADRGAAEDPARTLDLVRKGCALEHPRSCEAVAEILAPSATLPDGPRPDHRAAAPFHEKACEGGIPRSCGALASLYAAGSPEGVGTNPERAVVCLTRQCELNQAASCRILAGRLDRGDGVPAYPVRAEEYRKTSRALLERGCDLGVSLSCSNLAFDTREEDAADGFHRRALRIRERACRDGFGLACALAAMHHEHGQGVPVDAARSKELNDRAGSLGVTASCGVQGPGDGP